MHFGTAIAAGKFNRPLFGMLGEFSLSTQVSVPYFVVTMELERIVDELKTYDQIPPSLEQIWSLEELFQREVDYKRIEKEIVNGYLKDPLRLKYFNALTVALFPRSPDGALESAFDLYPDQLPPLPFEGTEAWDSNFVSVPESSFGGVQLHKVELLGRMRWDRNRVEAIAIDGQHRLAALRKWYEGKNKVLSSEEARTKVPVIFLLLHANAGFVAPDNVRTAGIRRIAREIFTDLNKNAKKVDDAREIILDDKSVLALCARELVTIETCQDSNDRLPLSLVRWQEPNPRFDQGYFINSLVQLQQLVASVLDLPRLHDALDIDDVVGYINSLGAALGAQTQHHGRQLHDGHFSLIEYYNTNYVDSDNSASRPFLHLPEQYLRAAIEAFGIYHKPYIMDILMRFRPYERLLEYARKELLITGFFAQWQAQPQEHRRQISAREERRDPHFYAHLIQVHVEAIENMKGRKVNDDENWSFKVIFQKAMIRVARVVCFESTHPETTGNIDLLLSYLNLLYDRGRFKLRALKDFDDALKYGLWAFLAITPVHQKIKVNRQVENNLFHALLLGYYANRKVVTDRVRADQLDSPGNGVPAKTRVSGNDLRKYFAVKTKTDGESPSQLWPRCNEAVESLEKVFRRHAEEFTSLPTTGDRDEAKEAAGRRRLASVFDGLAVWYDPAE
jgi:hypothetical protein